MLIKIKRFLIKFKPLIIILTIGLIMLVPIGLLIYNSTSNKRDFIFANYQSYMNPEVQKILKDKYGVNFDYFESAESAKSMLKKNTADIVNTTTYEAVNWAQQGLIKPMDWSKFGMKINDVESLLTPTVNEILKSYDIDGDGKNDNLLEYGIPYFLQDLVFCYRGKQIDELHQGDKNWEEVLDVIVKEERFKNNHQPNLISINDPRTIFSIPSSFNNNQINPSNNSSITELQNIYQKFSNKLNLLGKNSIMFNSDSSIVLNKIATNEVNGAFCFNGDALYAALGGDEGEEIKDDDIHIVKPKNNLVALDLIVINNDISDNNLNKAYELIKELCLVSKPNLSFDEIKNTTTFQNFDYVNYTSPLEDINKNLDQRKMKYLDIKNDNIINRIEKPLDDITKSNIQFAWTAFKSYL